MLTKNYSIILAVDEKNGIGKNGTIPWRLKKEQLFFKQITTSTKSKKKLNAVVMGRKTWESLPASVQPLPGRINCILSSDYGSNPVEVAENVYGFNSFEECHMYLSKNKKVDKIFIIGGSYLYNLVLESKYLEKIFITRVQGDFKCDVFFSQIPKVFKITRISDIIKEGETSYQMFEYEHGKNLLLKLKKPAFIFSSIAVIAILLLLVFLSISFQSNNQKVDNSSNIPSSSDAITEIQNPDTQDEQNTEIIEVQPEENLKDSFPIQEEITKEGAFYYPITNIAELDLRIRTYIRKKQIEYRIHNFNERETLQGIDNTLDYEVIDNSEHTIHIRFIETRNKNQIGTKDITYTKK